jgi:hypothetical protein
LWESSNTEMARLTMTPTASPDEGILVLVPVGSALFDGLLDLGPGLEPFRARERSTFHHGSIRLTGVSREEI